MRSTLDMAVRSASARAIAARWPSICRYVMMGVVIRVVMSPGDPALVWIRGLLSRRARVLAANVQARTVGGLSLFEPASHQGKLKRWWRRRGWAHRVVVGEGGTLGLAASDHLALEWL